MIVYCELFLFYPLLPKNRPEKKLKKRVDINKQTKNRDKELRLPSKQKGNKEIAKMLGGMYE